MSDGNQFELILTMWIASLRSRDRKAKSIRPNFEDLFQQWQNNGATFDDLYSSLLPKAIKAHLPPSATARNSYKSIKEALGYKFSKTEKEYIDDWHKSIHDIATEAFFEYFEPTSIETEDKEPKMYGNMSAKEYKAQRKYAEQFPILDTTELEKRLHEAQYNLDIEDMIKTVLGDTDENNP